MAVQTGTVKDFRRFLYIEPNYTFNIDSSKTTTNKEVLQAPNLEDYCIAVDLEAELVDRSGQFSLPSSFKNNTQSKQVIVLSWQNKEHGGEISFMSGRRIYKDKDTQEFCEGIPSPKRVDEGGTYWVNSLTTDYTGAYYDEMTHHGTTEMFGIKSIDIKYNSLHVPEINIKFTDVRGVSLLGNTERRKTQRYLSYDGLSADDMAEAFFQCFFSTPYPRFRLTVKGFYGKPVAYEISLQTWTASFNSSDGNFEIDANFLGYYYSFLSDVSMPALIAAPYCSYYGKEYWETQVANGTFVLKDGEAMPTMAELYKNLLNVYADTAQDRANTPEELEHKSNNNKMQLLQKIQDYHSQIVDKVVSGIKNATGDKLFAMRCHQFTKNDVINNLLSNDNETQSTDIQLICCLTSDSIDTFGTWSGLNNDKDFAQQCNTINEAIKQYNALCNSSNPILPELTANIKDIKPSINVLKLGQETTHKNVVKNDNISKSLSKKADLLVKKIQSIITSLNDSDLMQNGTFVGNVYFIEFPYVPYLSYEMQNIANELKKYNSDTSVAQRNKQEEEAIFKKLGSIYTIENITRMIMAHFDTFMHMMYKCKNEILAQERTLKSLGLDAEIFNDVNVDLASSDEKAIIPPFPSVVPKGTTATGEKVDGSTAGWVGDLTSGEYREKDLIYSIFQGADTVSTTLAKADQAYQDVINRLNQDSSGVSDTVRFDEAMNGKMGAYYLKNIVNIFDIFTTGYVYPDSIKTANDRSEFIKAISLRAFTTLSSDYYASNSTRIDKAAILGKADGYNFANQFSANANSEMYRWIQGATAEDFSDNNWKEASSSLFETKNGYPWLYKYPVQTGLAYPVQNYDISDNASKYASSNNSYIRYMPNLSIEDGLKYGKNCLSYKIVDFDTLREIPTTISSKLQSTELADSCVGGWLSAITFNSLEYGKIFDNTHHIIFNRTTNNYATNSDLSNIGDDNTGIKTNQFKICNVLPYHVNGDGLYAYGKKSKNSQIKTIKYDGDVYSYDVSHIYKQKLKKNGEAFFKIGDVIYRDEILKGVVPGLYIVVSRQISDNFVEYSLVNVLWLQSVNTQFSVFNELYYCSAYQTLRKTSNSQWLRAACIVCCMPIINYNQFHKLLEKNSDGTGKGLEKPFIIIPKLLAYQFGAILYAHDHYRVHGSDDKKNVTLSKSSMRKVLPCTKDDNVMYYLSSLSQESRQVLKNYFDKNCNNAAFVGTYEKAAKLKKRKGDIVFSYELGDDLLTPVMLIKTSRYAEGGSYNSDTKKYSMQTTGFTGNSYKRYMEGFLEGLKDAWQTGTVQENTGSSATELVGLSPNVTREMCISLYNYMKVLYDRWIPNFSESDWKLDVFFNNDSVQGHSFHFIDSYYTEVGDKAPVNLHTISTTIRNITKQNNFNQNLFSFLTDIYQQNYFMLVCTQNFMDISNKENMEAMFTPVSYLSMQMPKRHPDFVVIYMYSPSQRLNIAHNQYKDDSFMIDGTNMESLPLPLKGMDANGQPDQNPYKLPAFGVAYGMQYQNYFTDIAIDMNQAQATDVSIMTQMGIVEENYKSQGKTANFIGQDLFDVYSNNSWQCTIKMMGNAWVQPLMYFCLTNIPMFKGAYIIYKVNHNIVPGNMTTTITGMRMSRVMTPFNSHPYIAGRSKYDLEAEQKNRHRNASIANTCEYEVFPLFETDVVGENKKSILDSAVTSKMYRKGNQPVNNFSTVGEALTYAIMREDSTDDISICLLAVTFYNHSITNLNYICDKVIWSAYKVDLKKEYGGQTTKLAHIKDILYKTFENPAYFLSLGLNTTPYSVTMYSYSEGTYFGKGDKINVKRQLTATDLGRLSITANKDEWPSLVKNAKKGKSGYWPHHEMDIIANHKRTIYGAIMGSKPCWGATKTSANTSIKEKQNLIDAFMNAVKTTINSTDAVSISITHSVINKNLNTIKITQTNQGANQLCDVFDIILNGYYDYIKQLCWAIDSENKIIADNPDAIYVTLQNNTNPTDRVVGMGIPKVNNTISFISQSFEYNTAISGNYARAIYKKYHSDMNIYNKEVKTKINDLNTKVQITDCATYLQPQGQGGSLQGNYIGADRWNAGAASNFLIKYAYPSYNKTTCGNCANAVKSAIAVGGIPYMNNSDGGKVASQYIQNKHFIELGSGNSTKTDAKYKQLISSPQVGDICSFDYSGAGHVALYCSDGKWRSDYTQNQAAPNGNYNGKWQYARYSSEGGAVTKSNTTPIHWQHTVKDITVNVIH